MEVHLARLSSAEDSWSAGVRGTISSPNWFANSPMWSDPLETGGGKRVGEQRNFGYDSPGQVLSSRKLNEDTRTSLGVQRTFLDDVPRTLKTNGLT